MTRHAAPRRGFTMVELLVVIGVIAIMTGILVVAVPRVIITARNAGTATEIGQISNAIGTYKSKMNVQYIPSCGSGPGGTFQLKATYTGSEPEAIYLKQVFPQLNLSATGLKNVNLDCNQTLVFFLTGGIDMNFQGFSTNRAAPFTPPAANSTESRIGPFLDFPVNRYSLTVGTGTGQASLLDRFGSPFAYFAFNPVVRTWRSPVLSGTTYSYTGEQSFTFNSTPVGPYYDGTPADRKYLNPQGFQIISAGDNGTDSGSPHGFGPGGNGWTPGSGSYAEDSDGGDDLSNFNGGKLISRN